MSKLQDIRNLVQEHAVLVRSSPGDWMDYMDTASRLYRYSFSDQLLIHAQRPDATACASLELWNEKSPAKRNRKFPWGNSLPYLSCVDFCRVRPSGRTLFLF